MNQPIVSIIVPSYNVERYIEECLDSILAQTYQNIEVIVIDDGSTDATPYLLKPYESKVKLTLNELNKGQGAVRNQGIKNASGEYLLFVDSDDWIEQDTVERLVDSFLETQSDLVRFNGQSFFDGGDLFENSVQYDFSKVLDSGKIYEGSEKLSANQKAYSASPCLYMVSRALIMNKDIRFPESVLHEDEYFTTKVFLASQRMSYLNQFFYHRRYRVASTMTESTPFHKKRSFDSYLEVFKLLEKAYHSDQYDADEKVFLKRQLLSIYNGLQQSKVEPEMKIVLRDLKSVALMDKIRLSASRMYTKFKS